jgi:arsenate reductase
MRTGGFNVLFLSNRNAATSILAEAILRVEGDGSLRAHSAGLTPAAHVDPDVVTFLASRHIPVAELRAKRLSELEAACPEGFHFVITLSANAASFADGHAWRGDPVVANWTLEADGIDEKQDSSGWAMRDAFWTLSRRIKLFANLAQRKATRRSIQNRLNALQAL